MPGINRIKFYANICLIGIFSVVCYLPLMKTLITPSAAISMTEKRKLAEAPKLEMNWNAIHRFPGQFEMYFKDHFGFRNLLIFLNSYVSVKWVGVSPVSSVMLGKDGWFYWNQNRLADFRGANPMTPFQLERWKRSFEDKLEWMAHKGITYLAGIAPEKYTIYPQFLPEHIQKHQGVTRLMQLDKYILENSTFRLIDLISPLNLNKQNHQIYFKTDTHWNFRGGFVAYQAMITQISDLFPCITARPASFFQERINEHQEGGDMVTLLGLQHIIREDQPIFQPRFLCGKRWPYDIPLATRGSYAMGCKTEKLKAVVFRDSYFNFVLPFLSEHFGEIVYIWSPYNHEIFTQLIDDIQPDIVIEEILERFLRDDVYDRKGLNRIQDDLAPNRFKRSNQIYVTFDRKSGFPVMPVNDLEMVSDNSGLILKSAGEDPQLLLPDCIPDFARSLFIKIQITSPTNTELQLFYRTQDTTGYSEKKSVIQSLKQGLNEIYLYIPERDYDGPLRLDPGKQPGTYILHFMEIRGMDSETIRQTSATPPKSES